MVVILSATIISCTQAIKLINNITQVVGLTNDQKSEIIAELRKTIPFCPVIIKEDKK